MFIMNIYKRKRIETIENCSKYNIFDNISCDHAVENRTVDVVKLNKPLRSLFLYMVYKDI